VKCKALLIGNSDGIDLATTKELLKRGWNVVGISRSESPIKDPHYQHVAAEVPDDEIFGKI
jgi:NAD(P)-dependent dehydrogenase (short-subunit alcohol dehydrogenase family)